jgi:hypothetical protein
VEEVVDNASDHPVCPPTTSYRAVVLALALCAGLGKPIHPRFVGGS